MLLWLLNYCRRWCHSLIGAAAGIAMFLVCPILILVVCAPHAGTQLLADHGHKHIAMD